MTASLRNRLRSAYKRCDNPTERHNPNGSFTVGGTAWLATRELVQMVTEIDNALFRLEQLEKGNRPADFTEEEIEAAMADSYVSLPITDNAALAAAVNKAIESRYGPRED